MPQPLGGLHTAERVLTALEMIQTTSKLRFNYVGVELSTECDYKKIATEKCVLCDIGKTYDICGPVSFEKYFTLGGSVG